MIRLRARTRGFRRGGAAGVTTDPAVTAIRADGWSIDYTSPPTFDPVADPKYVVAVRERPYPDGSGGTSALSVTDNLVITSRVRQAYPNQASLDSTRCALSDVIYSTDTITGVANNSTETSPKPIANWVMPDRAVVGDSVTLEIVAFHRDARNNEQVAAVEFSVSDGTTTVRSIVTESVISGRTGDRQPVIVYRATIDVSSLANPATLTCNARVFPWVGGSASVLNSADSAVAREFSPRTFLRNTTLAAAPVYAYVATVAGATPQVSTNAATAKANPYGTMKAAIEALRTSQTVVDGCIVRLMAGTHVWNATVAAGTYQTTGELIIERDPDEAKANVTLAWGATANYSTRCNWVRIRDLIMVRQGVYTISGIAGSHMVFENCDLDNASYSAAWTTFTGGSMYGCTITNWAGSLFTAGTAENRLFRGLSISGLNGNIEPWRIIGCEFSASNMSFGRGARTQSGSIVAFNRFSVIGATVIGVGANESVTGVAIVQNIVENTGTVSNPQLRISADNAIGDNIHTIIHNNTFAGFDIYGRSNLFYEDGATPRTSKLMSCKGNIHVQINHKGDIFVTDGTRVGNWQYLYGAGCAGEFSQFIDADNGGLGGPFSQAYPGLNASIGTSDSVRNDPLFTDYEATTSGPTAGAGGGTYTVSASSPAKGRLAVPVLKFDLAGTARPTANDTSGAYV